MSQRIPDRFDPWRFADQGRDVAGRIPLQSLPRLRDCLLDASGEVDFDLHFDRDVRRRAVLKGVIETELALECQRCLQEMRLPVRAQVAIAFVEGHDQAERLPEALDPCLVDEGQVYFRDLIEDELLLALPQVAMHEEAECPVPALQTAEENGTAADLQPDNNPFAVLADLKRDKN